MSTKLSYLSPILPETKIIAGYLPIRLKGSLSVNYKPERNYKIKRDWKETLKST